MHARRDTGLPPEPMSQPSFFVTGASGFVRRHLCRRLRAAGFSVRGLVRRECPELSLIGVELIRGDLAEPSGWRDELTGTDYVIHCAANASFGNGPTHETVNVEGTRHLLEAVRQTGSTLNRLVFVSTIGAIERAPGDACAMPLDEESPPHPSSDYGRSKLRAEQLVRTSGLPFSIIRPAMVVGHDMRMDSHFAVFARAALNRTWLARFAWPGSFGVVHVNDLAAAIEFCATHPDAAGRTFFCGGSPVALRDSFKLARPEAGRCPLGWAAAFGRLDAPAWLIYLAAIFWTMGYDTIYALQDSRDDAIAGIRSTARLFGSRVRDGVGILYLGAILSGMAAILLARGGLAAMAGLFGFALHLGWQLRRIGPDITPALALRFRKRRKHAPACKISVGERVAS